MSVKQPPAMAKTKETKVTAKKKNAPAKTTQPPKATKSKAINLSEEKVVDSDSGDEAPVAKSTAKATPKSKEALKKTKSSAKAVSQQAEPKSKPKVGEQQKEESESEESSEEDSEVEQAVPSKPKQASGKTNGVKRKAEESSEESGEEESTSEEEHPAKKAKTSPEVDVQDSSSEEEDESSEDEDKGEDAKKPVVKTKKTETVPEVDMQDSSSEEDESSDESEDEESQPVKVTETKQVAKTRPAAKSKAQESSEEEDSSSVEEKEVATKRKDKPTTATGKPSIESIPAKPFEPPSGYKAIESSNLSSNSSFTSDNFAGKQIWHIIAPSNVPLKSITEVALDAVKSGTPVLNHKGVDYILAPDKSHSTKFDTVFIPSQSGYQSVGQQVDTTLQLQQKIELPNLSKLQADVNKGSNAAANIALAAISDARPQPKGLRMRYKPPGFGRGNPGRLGSESESSSEEDGPRSKKTGESLQFPKALGAHGASEKPDSGAAPAAEKSKKSKKKRKDADVEMVNGDLSMPPLQSTTPRKKKKKQEVI